ncbi:RES family NAD+ phosphorylase [Pantoea sp. A4]|uniref:RES family NAD+ phosphorylase n=1 Tax=Pantoea sp. A4 TaxID=1225184 RepID=UPI00036E0CA4|nr:RES family NAD+ phosphorylase [Pantoea sp. A4]
MKKWNFVPEKVAQEIAALKVTERKDTKIELSENSVLKRHQWKRYESSINFTAPQDSRDCGRYNPLGGRIAVWYASDAALTGMAESYGRVLQLHGTVQYPESLMAVHVICSVDVTKKVRVINVVRLCELLHIPLDSLESEDYNFTQWLMEHLYTFYGDKFDGIAYDSRHKRHKKCYAFWSKPGSEVPFKDTTEGIVSLAEYKEYDSSIFPPDWKDDYMSGDEMLELILNFEIMSEPQ